MERAIWRLLLVAGLTMAITGHIADGILVDASNYSRYVLANYPPSTPFRFVSQLGLAATAVGGVGLWLVTRAEGYAIK